MPVMTIGKHTAFPIFVRKHLSTEPKIAQFQKAFSDVP